MSTIKVNTIETVTGVEVYTAKAWVNFNGIGTVAIRDAGNVSSITDYGVANYGINFSTAMTDSNYATVGSAEGRTNHPARCVGPNFGVTPTTTLMRIYTGMPGGTNSTGIYEDVAYANISIHR